MSAPRCRAWTESDRRRCQDVGTLHARVATGTDRRVVLVHLCLKCAQQIRAQRWRPTLPMLLAIHDAAYPCRRPDAEWHDRGCIVPTVELTADDIVTATELAPA